MIAGHLGICTQTVSNCLNTDEVRTAVNEVWKNTVSRLSSGPVSESATTMARAAAPRMMQLAIQLAESAKSEAVRLQGISMILDRSHGKPTQRVVVDKMDEILEKMSPAELEAFHKDGTMPAWAEDLNALERESGTALH